MASIPPKPWSVDQFETHRGHLTTWLQNNVLPLLHDEGCRRVLIRAPVKSGKREMVEYLAMRDQARNAHRVHCFITAWHRTADEEQRKELALHNVKVFSIISETKVTDCKTWISAQLLAEKEIVLHLDECDHGSGHAQMLGKIWQHVREDDRITNILYSATPQEVIFSGEVEDSDHEAMVEEMFAEGERLEYTPPEGYCGPARFLREGLVHDAKPFFERTESGFALSAQGKELIAGLLKSCETTPRRNIVMLRLSYSELGGKREERKKNKAIYKFLCNLAKFPELADVLVVVDKEDVDGAHGNFSAEKIQWSNQTWWRRQATGVPMLFVVDQTCSRSTELACHDRLFAIHDYRNHLTYTVASQAQERVNHYEQRYGGFQRIEVYGHLKTFQLSAGQIDYEKYLTHPWKRRKVDRRTTGDDVELYQIKNTNTNKVHAEFNEMYSNERSEQILQELGCSVEIDISQRVLGGVKRVPEIGTAFVAATKETFDAEKIRALLPAAQSTRSNIRNPFVVAERRGKAIDPETGKFNGYLRGWKVLEYSSLKKERWGTSQNGGGSRITICYSDGELGVAVRWNVPGSSVTMNTLAAYKSMYGATD